MKTKINAMMVAVLALMLLVAACSSGSSSNTTAPPSNTAAPSNNTTALDGATLLQERCTVCHTLSRVESAKNTSAEWGSIVDRMIGKGAKLSSDEKALVVDYLSVTYGK